MSAGHLRDAQVTIIGLGLMGGSLAAALTRRAACHRVVGVVRREETAQAALAGGMVHHATTSLGDGLREADLVVLATPVRTILSLLGEIGPLLPPGCVVMDVGSTKRKVVAAMDALPATVEPLGGHPLCGKETSGLEAAEPTLYEGRVFVLTPLPRTSGRALALGRELVEAIGARPLILSPDQHDDLVAATSHLPYLLAVGLVSTAEEIARESPLLWELVASGFRDTSRLAASDVTMMADILLTNRTSVLEALLRYRRHLEELTVFLKNGDEAALRSLLDAAARRRGRLFP
jgi:prephenate dehydrogenase